MSKRFFRNRNNGTFAVISEEDQAKITAAHECGGDVHKLGVKIFTFCSPDRMRDNPEAKHIFTGNYDFMESLLCGHQVIEGGGYVPFSNHTEDGVHGEEEQARELLWRTTAQDVVDAFLS